MEEDSNLPPSKHQNLWRWKLWKKTVNFYVPFIFKGTGKKLLALFFSYIDTSNISIFLPENFPHTNIFITYKLQSSDLFAIKNLRVL